MDGVLGVPEQGRKEIGIIAQAVVKKINKTYA
jgi:hypothetical protein